MKKKKKRVLNLLLAVVLCTGLFPEMGFAANQANSATATSRTYDGTTTVSVTDMYFADAVDVDYERLSATGIGHLPSPNAGHYTSLNGITNMKLKERDPSLYPDDVIDWDIWYDLDENSFASTTIPTDVTIKKAVPELSITTDETFVKEEQEIRVTITLVNDFSFEAGLPTADQIELRATNAVMKEGTTLEQSGNQYTAVFVTDSYTSDPKAEFFANVSENADNYAALDNPVSTSVSIDFPADYTKVDEAISKAKSLNKDNYKNFSSVESAVNAVIRGKYSSEQNIVDGYAAAIENAIAALEYKDADYSKVDEAIYKAKALNKDDYLDFSAVETAVNAVIRGKNITEQSIVDGYASAIESALAALQKAPETTETEESSETEENSETEESSETGENSETEESSETGESTAIEDSEEIQETEPSAETYESKDNQKESATHTDSPKTGDASDPSLWFSLLGVSAAALMGILIYISKRK